MLFGTAIVVGAGTGLGAVFFIWLIAQVQNFFYQTGGSVLGFLGRGLFILTIVADRPHRNAACRVVGLLTHDFTPEERVQFGIADQDPTCQAR